MSIWLTPIDLETVIKRGENSLSHHFGIEYIEVGDDYLVAKMKITPQLHQPMGIMHGGASCVLAETVGSAAANFCVDTNHFYCVGLEINTNHIRSIREGYVIGTAKPYHLGRSTQVWSIEIKNEEGKLISINRLTMAVLKR